MKIKKNGKVIRLTESDLKRIVKRVLTEDSGDELTYDEIMATTRNPEDMTLIGPDGNEVKVRRHHIDGTDVVMTAYTTLIDKNQNTKFKLTFGGNTYTGSFHPTEKQILMDIPNSKYMIRMFVDEESKY